MEKTKERLCDEFGNTKLQDGRDVTKLVDDCGDWEEWEEWEEWEACNPQLDKSNTVSIQSTPQLLVPLLHYGNGAPEKSPTVEFVGPLEDVVAPPDNKQLKSPICCVLGHVDTGKTSLLDTIRRTNVQEGEPGGITQQIGATYFPMTTIQEQTASLCERFKLSIEVPGLLIIDTPGHESFNNMRSRGSGLCNIAILVVDIMHGLEQQTIESINLLRLHNTPFVVALNKVDRIYGWKSVMNNPFEESLKRQTKTVAKEFDTRVKETVAAFAAQGLNAVLHYRNQDFRNYVSLVPTSAVSGEGIPDLLMMLVQLTQRMMKRTLQFTPDVRGTVLEVRTVEGYGTTIDVILQNGKLCEGDTIVLSGTQGPIVTTVRTLLMPQPLRELRVKGTYLQCKEVKAARGIKIVAQDLDNAVAGSTLFVVGLGKDVDMLCKEVQRDFDSFFKSIEFSSRGICVHASTLGSLEALLQFLKASNVPVAGATIGTIHKKDVMRASMMLERNLEFAVILAFDVKVDKDAQLFADKQGVKIFIADIIYHLFDSFTKYKDELNHRARDALGQLIVWPCILHIKPDCIFNKKHPIVLGVKVTDGVLRVGTPICVPSREFIELGIVTSIQHNHQSKQEAKKGDEVAIKIETTKSGETAVFGRQFNTADALVSRVSETSINALLALFNDELSENDKQLIARLQSMFHS